MKHLKGLIPGPQQLTNVAKPHWQYGYIKDNKKIIDIGDYYGDYSLFTKDTGWSPKVDLIEGITRTIDFYNHYKKEYWL